MANNASEDKISLPLNVIDKKNANEKLLHSQNDRKEFKNDLENDMVDEKTRKKRRAGEEEEEMVKDRVITIDTTDKRAHRNLQQDYSYAAKKTVAQGMMDIALITANANQLRYLVEYQRNSVTFYINVVLIVISLILQIAVGISLIFKGRFDMQGRSNSRQAKRINNYVIVGVFLITVINVFVAAFSISPANPLIPPVQITPSAKNISL